MTFFLQWNVIHHFKTLYSILINIKIKFNYKLSRKTCETYIFRFLGLHHVYFFRQVCITLFYFSIKALQYNTLVGCLLYKYDF